MAATPRSIKVTAATALAPAIQKPTELALTRMIPFDP
jgi:hypothetical protein